MLVSPLFKGCTRPPMLLGAPMKPLVLVIGLCALAGVWVMVASVWLGAVCLALAVPAWLAMRHVSARDDQRLNQYLLLCMLRPRQRATPRLRGARVYTPCRRALQGANAWR